MTFKIIAHHWVLYEAKALFLSSEDLGDICDSIKASLLEKNLPPIVSFNLYGLDYTEDHFFLKLIDAELADHEGRTNEILRTLDELSDPKRFTPIRRFCVWPSGLYLEKPDAASLPDTSDFRVLYARDAVHLINHIIPKMMNASFATSAFR